MEKREKRLIIILTLFVIAFIACLGVIMYNAMKTKKENDALAKLEEFKKEYVEEQVVEEVTEVTETVEEEQVQEYVSPIDFAKLKAEVNKDIYAWIKVEGTDIDYPILQHPTDDSYYLTHNLDDTVGYPGCIYTEKYNSQLFMDPVTVIYGHNMKNGSMFAGLHKFKNRAFFDENDSIEIFLPYEKKEYTIIGAFYTNNNRITAYYRTWNQEGKEEWLETVRSVVESDRDHLRDVEYGNDDTYIVLETCVGKDKSHRLIVVGVLNKE